MLGVREDPGTNPIGQNFSFVVTNREDLKRFKESPMGDYLRRLITPRSSSKGDPEKQHATFTILRKGDVTQFDDETVIVFPRGWTAIGYFNKAECTIPLEQETPVLIFIQGERTQHGFGNVQSMIPKIVGIDAVYVQPGPNPVVNITTLFKSATCILNRKPEEILLGAEVVRSSRPRQTVKFGVVADENGRNVFKYDNTHFDCLVASKELRSGVLTIYRNGCVFDKTMRIGQMRKNSDSEDKVEEAFCGLMKVIPGEQRSTGHDLPIIPAEYLMVGDELVLHVFKDVIFDFGQHLLNVCDLQSEQSEVGEEIQDFAFLEMTA